ncbi:transketolase family protein [Pyrococcus abyssi]|uniref:Transketolase c-terminal section n=1 Tax=Pyrococcus abyssi (strain GE5 / Orsay) TaxID=272844 RepID=Q9V1I1_PYRAB|nr:transketolase family protein [Pyrococcus abyssi]CAB49368.1 tkt2 transketolase C-terminal section [Pyrococcus abyssi GE5]CCE69829.1 TPA: transketolase c-terminal section [Pyrococcus abyssi GE5]
MIESFRESFGRTLVEIGRKNKDVIVVDADVKNSTKTVYFENQFPDRFIQVGISEQDMIGTAAGLAIAGKIPIVSAFAAFLMRAWEQIRNTIARDNLNVKIVATHSGFSDFLDGSSHQCLEDIALMRVLPNMKVVVPADAYATRALLYEIVEDHGPAYMRLGRDFAPRVYEDGDEIKLGKANILRDGSDILFVASGVMVSVALEVAENLKGVGIDAGVLDMHTVKPLDERTLINLARKVNLVITLEEHTIFGGLGGAVAEALSEKMPRRVIRIGSTTFGRSSRDYLSLLDRYGLSVNKVYSKVLEVVKNEDDEVLEGV